MFNFSAPPPNLKQYLFSLWKCVYFLKLYTPALYILYPNQYILYPNLYISYILTYIKDRDILSSIQNIFQHLNYLICISKKRNSNFFFF